MGSFVSARAMATRWRSPRRACLGRGCPVPDGACLQQLVGLATRSRLGSPRPIIGTWTFSRAFSVGIRWWNWNTKPTVEALYCAGSGRCLRSVPPTLIVPGQATSSAPTRLSSVLLPQPDGPTTEANSPGSSANETSSKATMCPSSNDFVTFDDDVGAAASSLAHFGFTSRFRIFLYVLPPIFDLIVQRGRDPAELGREPSVGQEDDVVAERPLERPVLDRLAVAQGSAGWSVRIQLGEPCRAGRSRRRST